MEWCHWSIILVSIFIVYKVFDRILRLFYIGHYSERYIFITGCDTGFGNMTAKRLDALGCHVFAGCLTETGETELRKSCSTKLVPVPLDVTKHESVLNAFGIVKAKLPANKGLWGILNNAGILGFYGQIAWLKVESFKEVNAINLYGMIDVTITFLPLVKKEKGRVANTSSVRGRCVTSLGIQYGVSKYGVEAFTDGLRRECYAFGVKACLIEPSGYKTPLMSAESLRCTIKRAWDQTSPEVLVGYDEAYIQQFTTEMTDLAEKMTSDRISEVVDAYEHALLGRFPRARYLVGSSAKFFWRPLTWLPEWLSDLIMRKLRIDGPPPNTLQK